MHARARIRPYWHVDAKWITALLLVVALNLAFPSFLLAQLTAPDPGIDLLTLALASAYSPAGLDDPYDIEVMRQNIAVSVDQAWQPISELNIAVTAADLQDKTPRQVRLWFFRQLAEPLYTSGAQGLLGLSNSPNAQERLQGGVGLLGFFSAEMHAWLQIIFIFSAAGSLALLGLLAYFSYRFGRLGSPGCVLFIAALPGLWLSAAALGWVEQFSTTPLPVKDSGWLGQYTQFILEAFPGFLQQAWQAYVVLWLVGLGLLAIALLGALIWRAGKSV